MLCRPVKRFGSDTTLEDAARIAEKLGALIAGYEFWQGITVSASFGVATLQTQEPLGQLFIRTDTALYEAKHPGRNQVVMSTGKNGEYTSTPMLLV